MYLYIHNDYVYEFVYECLSDYVLRYRVTCMETTAMVSKPEVHVKIVLKKSPRATRPPYVSFL